MTESTPALTSKDVATVQISDGGSGMETSSAPAPKQSKPGHIHNRVVRLVIIGVMSVFCVASASCHTLFAQPFKRIRTDPNLDYTLPANQDRRRDLDSPLLFAVLTSGSFPIAFLFWIISCRGRIVAPTWRQWKAFSLLALPESANIMCSSYGLSALNATEYAIIRGTSLIFVVALSKMMTHKKFNLWQYVAVAMMSVALVLIGINPKQKATTVAYGLHYWIGFAMAVCGSIFVSLLSVLTQKLFASEQSKGDLTFICQINTCQSFLSTLIVLPVFLFKELGYVRANYAEISALGRLPMFWGLLIGMWVASPLMLFTNIGLTSFSSATFSRSLGGPKRVVCILLGHWLFADQLNSFTITAAVLLFFSLGVYIYGGHLLQVSKSSKHRSKL